MRPWESEAGNGWIAVGRLMGKSCQKPSVLHARHGDLWKTLTPRRWALIRAMADKGAMSTRAAGRLIGQDIKTVHADVQALLGGGILEKDAAGRVRFPDDAIHVDFMIEAA